MSTGGAAMKAMMKQVVAVSRVGIINTPNQPTYRRLSVEVTQLQNVPTQKRSRVFVLWLSLIYDCGELDLNDLGQGLLP
jgi:hypothetical protein